MRKEIHDIFRTKNPTKDQIKKYKRRERDLDPNSTALLCMFVVISCQE